ncbi:MurR/RpiR family transcriptional regulator [Denitrobaculum tricleocarpae]|uniref:MurR/RpiR family transcriptional regulator n=1 Tax=Denitrobaculum tricleocarpae TaxID=2591009 RepID=A0A545U1K8_9PROT|nr:MurR/RpiR family transcriptional regulator [Denitrobaculum tricleocarpae]TQV83369.1 MurR/RpiR family transcriptional regulator [Denitrobaculum tricleocarpae]
MTEEQAAAQAGPPIDIILRLRNVVDSLSASEKQVAAFILDDLERATLATVSGISEAVGVSEPTVIRFCRSLGCEGFKDFKIRLARNLAVSLQYINPETTAANDRPAFSDLVFSSLVETLKVARNQLDAVAIDKAAKMIDTARQVAFYGVGGGSSIVAQDAANRFFRIGVMATAHSDGYLQRMHASTLGEGDVAVAISATGRPEELIDSLTIARQYGAATLSLTKPGSPLTRVSDVVIELDLPEHPEIFKPTATRLVFLCVIDVLATQVGYMRGEEVRETLRRIRSSLSSLHETIDPQPIGD